MTSTTHADRAPLLKPWYRLARLDGKVVLEYGQSIVVFEGEATSRLLPALLPLLDGTRTIEEIVVSLGEPARPAIENAIALLDRHRLLTDAEGDGGDLPDSFVQTARFLAATAGGDLSVSEARERLARARAAILGGGSVAAEAARVLRLSGLADIGRLSGAPLAREAETLDLALAVPNPYELQRLARWNEVAIETRTPWLQVLPFDGRAAVIGPLFVPGETCCYECFRIRRAANVGYAEEFWALEEVPAPYPTPPAVTSALAALAVTQAVRWLATRDPALPGTLCALECRRTIQASVHHVYRVPRCAVCSPASGAAPPSPWFEGELTR